MKTTAVGDKSFIALCVVIAMVLCSFSPHYPYQQDSEPVDTTLHVGQEVFVIEPAGIPLRDTPRQSGKTLRHIAYGEKMKISRLLNLKRDTVVDAVSSLKLSGYWIEVTYGDQKGYVFSTQVFEVLRQFNQKALLLFQYEGCEASFKYDRRLNYYGLYREGNGMVLKKVAPAFSIERSVDMIGDGHIYRLIFKGSKQIDVSENPLFVLGIQKELSEGKTRELSLSEKDRTIVGGVIKSIPQAHLTLQANTGIVKVEQEKPLKRQALGGLHYVQRLHWCGDVDQDGRLDFLFFAGDKGMDAVLFLSSLAKENELVGYADSFFFPLCC